MVREGQKKKKREGDVEMGIGRWFRIGDARREREERPEKRKKRCEKRLKREKRLNRKNPRKVRIIQ